MKARLCLAVLGAFVGMGLGAGGAWATVQPRQNNIVDLVSQSELILRGTVTKLSDGIDERGIPYTEVTLQVADAIRGEVGNE